MSKSAEDLYTEKVEESVRDFLTERLQGAFWRTDVEEFLEDRSEYDQDLVSDVANALDSTLDTMLQRWLDD